MIDAGVRSSFSRFWRWEMVFFQFSDFGSDIIAADSKRQEQTQQGGWPTTVKELPIQSNRHHT